MSHSAGISPQTGARMAQSPGAPSIDFETVFEASPNPYMLLDTDLRFVAANQAYLHVSATRLDNLLGRRVLDVFPNDAGDPNNASALALLRSLQRVIQTGEPDVIAWIAYRVARFDGGPLEERYWSATNTPIHDDRGNVKFILQHVVDVTELGELRRLGQADESARDREARSTRDEAGVLGRAKQAARTAVLLDQALVELRQMFEQAPGFMCFLRGPEHVIEIANAAYLQLVGHRDIIGKSARVALPEFQAQGYLELLDRVVSTGQAFVGRSMRAMLETAPGAPLEERFLDLVFQPIVSSSGEPRGVFIQGNDITEQKRQNDERAALVERERLAREEAESAATEQQFLAESIPQQVWTAGPDGLLDLVNERVVEYFQRPREQILGSGWQSGIHPDDLEKCMERWRRSLTTGEAYEVEFRLLRSDGEYRWHLARAIPLRDRTGTVLKWFGTNTDIDEVNRIREELRSRSDSEQQLIGIVSHDLRNPLNSIGLSATLLLAKRGPDDPERKALARIEASTRRAARLISDFLDFAQTRVSGDIPIRPAAFNLREMIARVVEEVELSNPARPVRVVHNGEETGSWDADRLHQVLGNLVGNAFQHSLPAAEIRVTSSIDENAAEIEVYNEGPPIAAEDIAGIFEPFRRGGKAATTRGRSVGLGLYIARQVVRSHGGTLDVYSDQESGTRFVVRLPRQVVAKARTSSLP